MKLKSYKKMILQTENTLYHKVKPNSLLKTKTKTQLTPLSSQKPKNQTISFPQNQNPKLRWERSKRSEVPFLCNLRFSHTMATDSSDQLNFNPTTTTEENPKQTLDDDTTLTSVSSLQLHVNTGQNSGFNSPLLDSLCSMSYCLHVLFQTNKRRKK